MRTALVTPGYIIYVQIGDGDILAVTEEGAVVRPFPNDERLIANETTSLASPDAWQDIRVEFQALAGAPPALIMMLTDGYANSFRDEEAFSTVASDLFDMIRNEGLDAITEQLSTWLTEASELGSGDDVTLGLLCREDVHTAAVHPEMEEAPGDPESGSKQRSLEIQVGSSAQSLRSELNHD